MPTTALLRYAGKARLARGRVLRRRFLSKTYCYATKAAWYSGLPDTKPTTYPSDVHLCCKGCSCAADRRQRPPVFMAVHGREAPKNRGNWSSAHPTQPVAKPQPAMDRARQNLLNMHKRRGWHAEQPSLGEQRLGPAECDGSAHRQAPCQVRLVRAFPWLAPSAPLCCCFSIILCPSPTASAGPPQKPLFWRLPPECLKLTLLEQRRHPTGLVALLRMQLKTT